MTEQHHAPGTEAAADGWHRGLCWCGRRGTWRDGEMAQAIAYWDAELHVRACTEPVLDPAR